jgi:hypothetical protein
MDYSFLIKLEATHKRLGITAARRNLIHGNLNTNKIDKKNYEKIKPLIQ